MMSSPIDRGPLIDQLMKIDRDNPVSFHMPGHKRGAAFFDRGASLLPDPLSGIDVTEMPGTDHLHNPTGVIREAQERAARVFGSEATHFLVNGSTGGIYAMILATAGPGEEILMNRNAHQSVYHACLLGGITPRYIRPALDEHLGLPVGPTPEDVSRSLREWPNVKAVVITRPTYHGFVPDLADTVRRAHQLNKPVLVDEAHGAHLSLSNRLPDSAMAQGADAAVQSTHKTMPAFTQASMLHVKGPRMDRDRLTLMLRLFQSSSPSYLLMSSLDAAVTVAEREGPEKMERLLDNLTALRQRLAKTEGLMMTGKPGWEPTGQDVDPTRLWIDLHQRGLNGYQAEERLRLESGIQMEMADLRGTLALTSIGNTSRDLERLGKAVEHLVETTEWKGKSLPQTASLPPLPRTLPRVYLGLWEALARPRKRVPLTEAVGCVSAANLVPYPPGIPLVVPGELVSEDTVEYLVCLTEAGMEVLGVHYTPDPVIEVAVIS